MTNNRTERNQCGKPVPHAIGRSYRLQVAGCRLQAPDHLSGHKIPQKESFQRKPEFRNHWIPDRACPGMLLSGVQHDEASKFIAVLIRTGERYRYAVFDVQCWTFDVQCSQIFLRISQCEGPVHRELLYSFCAGITYRIRLKLFSRVFTGHSINVGRPWGQ